MLHMAPGKTNTLDERKSANKNTNKSEHEREGERKNKAKLCMRTDVSLTAAPPLAQDVVFFLSLPTALFRCTFCVHVLEPLYCQTKSLVLRKHEAFR